MDNAGKPIGAGDGNPHSGQPAPARLPFRKTFPLLAGVAAGLVLRLFYFGEPGEPFAAMLGSFIYLAPMLVGAVTVYVAERTERRSWVYYVTASFMANVFFVLGTLLILIEGLICAAVIIPLFSMLGIVGGLVMGTLCRLLFRPERPLYGFALLPFLLGYLNQPPEQPRLNMAERSILIDAPASRVWEVIQNSADIQPDEVDAAWLYRIGVPLPISGVTRDVDGERLRTIRMGKSVHFDQVITHWEENGLMKVKYRYQPDSFPPFAMDEHVVLGGHYFDVESTAYILRPRGEKTELAIQLEYTVRTHFNWYADPVAQFLFTNFEQIILNFYRQRSEMES